MSLWENKTVVQNQEAIPLASPTARISAFIFDVVLISPLIRLVGSPLQRRMLEDRLLEQSSNWSDLVYGLISLIIFLFIFISYQTVMLMWRGQSFGKVVFGIKVVSTGKKLGWLSALTRSLFTTVSFFTFGLPFLSLFYHPLRRGFHDRVTDTLVVALRDPVGQPAFHERRNSLGILFATFAFMFVVFVSGTYIFWPSQERQKDHWELTCGWGDPEVTLADVIERSVSFELDNDCLREFAEIQIWAQNAEAEALFAIALSYQENQEKSDRYLQNICHEYPEDRMCFFSRWLSEQVSADQFVMTEDLAKVFDLVEVENYMVLFVSSYTLKYDRPDLTDAWLKRVKRPSALSRTLTRASLERFIRQKKWFEASILYHGQFQLGERELVKVLFKELESEHTSPQEVLMALKKWFKKKSIQPVSETQRSLASVEEGPDYIKLLERYLKSGKR